MCEYKLDSQRTLLGTNVYRAIIACFEAEGCVCTWRVMYVYVKHPRELNMQAVMFTIYGAYIVRNRDY